MQLTVSRNRLFFFCLTFTVQLFIIILYEFDILSKFMGYSDWDFYKQVLLFGRNENGFVGILNSFHNVFSNYSLYVWYFIEIFLNSFLLSALLSRIQYQKQYFLLFAFLNPFFILFYTGIYKEAFLLDIVIFAAIYKSLIFKVFSIFNFGIIRAQLFPFIVFLYTKFNLFIYFVFALISLYIINTFHLIDFNFISGSIKEIQGIDKNDFPIEILSKFSIITLIKNLIIILFGYIFINSIPLKIMYFFSVSFYLYFYLKNKLYKLLFSFLLGLLPYSLILTNAGTALRIITFLFIATIVFHFIPKSQKI